MEKILAMLIIFIGLAVMLMLLTGIIRIDIGFLCSNPIGFVLYLLQGLKVFFIG